MSKWPSKCVSYINYTYKNHLIYTVLLQTRKPPNRNHANGQKEQKKKKNPHHCKIKTFFGSPGTFKMSKRDKILANILFYYDNARTFLVSVSSFTSVETFKTNILSRRWIPREYIVVCATLHYNTVFETLLLGCGFVCI